MSFAVAGSAQRGQIILGVCSPATPWEDVVDIELLAIAAYLTPPAIALENPQPQFFVVRCRQAMPRALASIAAHADLLLLSRNRCCCGEGRKWKNLSSDISRASGLPFSKFAPARKSAQIISRQ